MYIYKILVFKFFFDFFCSVRSKSITKKKIVIKFALLRLYLALQFLYITLEVTFCAFKIKSNVFFFLSFKTSVS